MEENYHISLPELESVLRHTEEGPLGAEFPVLMTSEPQSAAWPSAHSQRHCDQQEDELGCCSPGPRSTEMPL